MEEKAEKSDLAKHLTDVYMACGENASVLDKLEGTGTFDQLRIKTTKLELERLKKERDPATRTYQESRFFQQLKQDLGYFTGFNKYAGKFDDMADEEQVGMYTNVGIKVIDDIINPVRN